MWMGAAGEVSPTPLPLVSPHAQCVTLHPHMETCNTDSASTLSRIRHETVRGVDLVWLACLPLHLDVALPIVSVICGISVNTGSASKSSCSKYTHWMLQPSSATN